MFYYIYNDKEIFIIFVITIFIIYIQKKLINNKKIFKINKKNNIINKNKINKILI